MTEEQTKSINDKWCAHFANHELIQIDKIDRVFTNGTHPFTIGPQHVGYASDHCGGRLGEEAMQAHPCADRHCRRPYDDACHRSTVACYVRLRRECVQAEVCQAINAVKADMEKDGVEGFAFVNHTLVTDWGK